MKAYVMMDMGGWHDFYLEKLGGFPLDENYWDLLMIPGLHEHMIVDVFKKELGVKVYSYHEGEALTRSIKENRRDPNKDSSYIERYHRSIEASEIVKNQSVNDRKKKGIKDITLKARLLMGLGYYLETKTHLDPDHFTVCGGSLSVVGDVPRVGWSAGSSALCIGGWWSPGDRSSDFRTRPAVSELLLARASAPEEALVV